MKGGGTDAPEEDAEEEEIRPSVSYDDMWAKALLDGSDSSVIITLPRALQGWNWFDFCDNIGRVRLLL